jgi:hypothetical protein
MTAVTPTPIEYQPIGLTEGGDAGDLLAGLDQKQGRARLQALISVWLRMENLVVLTGSGTFDFRRRQDDGQPGKGRLRDDRETVRSPGVDSAHHCSTQKRRDLG